MARRSALLIACDTFDEGFSPLRAPVREAEDLSLVLRDELIGGFEVKLIANHKYHEIQEAIQEFFASSTRDDLLLLYLAGHGALDSRRKFYYVATNTKQRTLPATGIRGDFIHEQLQECRSMQKVLIVDCCYSGAVVATDYSIRSGEAVDIRRMATKGTVVLAASDSYEHAFERTLPDMEAPRSIFSSRLVEGLQSGDADLDVDGRISTDDLYDYLVTRIRAEDSAQNPIKGGVMDGLIVIANVRTEVHESRKRRNEKQKKEEIAIQKKLAEELERERKLRELAESEKQLAEEVRRENTQRVEQLTKELQRQRTQHAVDIKSERDLRELAEKHRAREAKIAQETRDSKNFWQNKFDSIASSLSAPEVYSWLFAIDNRRATRDRYAHLRNVTEDQLNLKREREWEERLKEYTRSSQDSSRYLASRPASVYVYLRSGKRRVLLFFVILCFIAAFLTLLKYWLAR